MVSFCLHQPPGHYVTPKANFKMWLIGKIEQHYLTVKMLYGIDLFLCINSDFLRLVDVHVWHRRERNQKTEMTNLEIFL